MRVRSMLGRGQGPGVRFGFGLRVQSGCLATSSCSRQHPRSTLSLFIKVPMCTQFDSLTAVNHFTLVGRNHFKGAELYK
jgi:hypothetical protein